MKIAKTSGRISQSVHLSAWTRLNEQTQVFLPAATALFNLQFTAPHFWQPSI